MWLDWIAKTKSSVSASALCDFFIPLYHTRREPKLMWILTDHICRIEFDQALLSSWKIGSNGCRKLLDFLFGCRKTNPELEKAVSKVSEHLLDAAFRYNDLEIVGTFFSVFSSFKVFPNDLKDKFFASMDDDVLNFLMSS
jgi:hypothetical protein